MKHNLRHHWYAIIIAIAAPLLVHILTYANMDSYNISTGGANQQTPLDATIDSLKTGAARALKTPKADDQKISDATDQTAAPQIEEEKGWFRTKIDTWFDPKNKKKTLRHMNFAELEAFKQKCLEDGDRYNAIRTLERMVPICTDLEKLRIILLELADLLFDDGRLEAAGKMYREFVKYYPGNEKVQYALYKAIVCKFYVILDAERDQSATQEAIELANKFLEREEIFTSYSKEVRSMRAQCYQRLFDSEINIFNFYCDRGRYKSAKTRLTNVRKEFITLIPDCDLFLLNLEIQLAQTVNDTAIITEKQKERAERFPQQEATVVAQANPQSSGAKKKRNIDRF